MKIRLISNDCNEDQQLINRIGNFIDENTDTLIIESNQSLNIKYVPALVVNECVISEVNKLTDIELQSVITNLKENEI